MSYLHLAIFFSFSFTLLAHEYIGSQACKACHPGSYKEWLSSHHFFSMQSIDKQNLNKIFSSGMVEANGETFQMSLANQKPQIKILNTKTKKQTSVPVLYSFGHYPLQMFLVPGERGKLQALPLAWDQRPQKEGGERWFALYPKRGPTLLSNSYLHTWNNRCAFCHSTGYEKHWSEKKESFASTFQEENVACEACHGPGRKHQKEALENKFSAQKGFSHELLRAGNWLLSEQAPVAQRVTSPSSKSDLSLETCGGCHSRRVSFLSDPAPDKKFAEQYELAFLDTNLYTQNGLIQEEVFEMGSFMASKMHDRGVTCVDCHHHHTGQLKRPGNLLCQGCHQESLYSGKSHTKHLAGQADFCTSCHMPKRTYMQVHERHDHSFSRPHKGSLDACMQCHKQNEAVVGEKFVALWPKQIATHNSNLWTQASRLASLPFSQFSSEFGARLGSSNPLWQLAALKGLANLSPNQEAFSSALLLSSLQSPLRPVHLRATSYLWLAGVSLKTKADNDLLAVRKKELSVFYQKNLDLEENVTTWAELLLKEKRSSEAIVVLTAGLKRLPESTAIASNLADVYRLLGQENRVQEVFLRGIEKDPENSIFHYGLALSYIRVKNLDKAIHHIKQSLLIEKTPPGFLTLASIYLAQKKFREAKEQVLAGKKYFPNALKWDVFFSPNFTELL